MSVSRRGFVAAAGGVLAQPLMSAAQTATATTTATTTALTPSGAIAGASADGRIPAWAGGLQEPPAGWSAAMGYRDPFPQDVPLAVIGKSDAAAFRQELPDGLAMMLDRVPGMRLRLFPTRRTAGYPAEISAAMAARTGSPRLSGHALAEAGGRHLPFPEPVNGLEAIWNVLRRFTGGGVVREGRSFVVRANGDSSAIGFWSRRFYASHLEGAPEDLHFVAMGGYLAPASLRGQIVLVHEPSDLSRRSRSAWIYSSALRRVRRAPDLAYDAVADGSEGIFTADQVDGFNGSPDRFDWVLQGRRAMIVPYNTYAIAESPLVPSRLLHKGSVNPDLMRYELHRVWVVEARLRQGQSHVYGLRRFLIDEDSWTVLIEEAYSPRGDLWRVALHGVVQFYDARLPGVRASVYHDLDSGSYFVSGLDADRQPSIRFHQRGRFSDFLPDAMVRMAT